MGRVLIYHYDLLIIPLKTVIVCILNYTVLVFMTDEGNKIRSYNEKMKFSVFFMLLFTIISFYPLFDSHIRKQNFF